MNSCCSSRLLPTTKSSVQHHRNCCSQLMRGRYISTGRSSSELLLTESRRYNIGIAAHNECVAGTAASAGHRGVAAHKEGVGATSSEVLLTTHASPVQQHRQRIRELLLTKKASVQHHRKCCSQRMRRRYSSIGSASSELLFTTKASSVQHHRSCCSHRLRRGTLRRSSRARSRARSFTTPLHHKRSARSLRTAAERAQSRVNAGAARHEEGAEDESEGGRKTGAEATKGPSPEP